MVNGIARAAVHNDRIDALEPRSRLAQRTGRQQQLVAEPTCTVDDRDLEIAPHSIMLKPVVADDDVALAMRFEKRASRGHSIASDPYGTAAAPREKQRLV